jgi:hypothetical protein
MKHLFPLVLLTAMAAAGCNTQTADNSGSTTTTPSAPTITEPAFTGTLSASQNGGQNNVYTFSVTQVGPLTVTLTAAGPPSGVAIGLAIGTPTFSTTGTTCSPIATNNNAQVGVNAPQISGTVSASGPYCLAVFGIPPITVDLTYSVTVAHT